MQSGRKWYKVSKMRQLGSKGSIGRISKFQIMFLLLVDGWSSPSATIGKEQQQLIDSIDHGTRWGEWSTQRTFCVESFWSAFACCLTCDLSLWGVVEGFFLLWHSWGFCTSSWPWPQNLSLLYSLTDQSMKYYKSRSPQQKQNLRSKMSNNRQRLTVNHFSVSHVNPP